MRSTPLIVFVLCCALGFVKAQYEDARCKCVCPNPSVVNGTQSNRKHYIGNVPPNKCNCDNVVLPKVADDIKGKEQEFCPRCECIYESRNTTTIKVVVIIVIWIISLLVIYMLFLICLDPLLNKRVKGSYHEQTNEEDEAAGAVEENTVGRTAAQGPSVAGAPPPGQSHPMRVRGNVLNRVGHQQDKWKRQVREQRRHIYDRHTMLN
ncbi:uncharacterized protein CG1161 [Ischnura elegans]|uniref:uncharacterized protein CG1161 n=1 Tax=Ischnura elegans TaxID=197161 RepID=UPI001ED87B59|nr:uncharacterized protein CG1161 [Ischnura elegans]